MFKIDQKLELADALEKRKPIQEVRGLVVRHRGGVIATPSFPPIDLDCVPFKYDQYLMRRNYTTELFHTGAPSASVITSKGCQFSCIFCSEARRGSTNLRYRSISRVMEELRYLYSVGIRRIYFEDDTFTVNRSRVVKLCEAIRGSGLRLSWHCETRADMVDRALLKLMAASGCTHIFYGVESLVDEILQMSERRMHVSDIFLAVKATQDVGIRVFASIQVGLPGEDGETIRETVRKAQDLGPDIIGLSFTSVYPGTRLFTHVNLPQDVYEWYQDSEELLGFKTECLGHGVGVIHPYFLRAIDTTNRIIDYDVMAMKSVFRLYQQELGEILWTPSNEPMRSVDEAYCPSVKYLVKH